MEKNTCAQTHTCIHLYAHTHTHTQWKTANSENIGEHKLKCVFDVEVFIIHNINYLFIIIVYEYLILYNSF